MHEMSLCESVLAIVEDTVRTRGPDHDRLRVSAVWLEIGELSHAEPEALRFCFAAVVRGTVADGARLEILRPPGRAWCLACEKTVAVHRRYDPCPDCGGHQLAVTGGDGLRVTEIEVA